MPWVSAFALIPRARHCGPDFWKHLGTLKCRQAPSGIFQKQLGSQYLKQWIRWLVAFENPTRHPSASEGAQIPLKIWPCIASEGFPIFPHSYVLDSVDQILPLATYTHPHWPQGLHGCRAELLSVTGADCQVTSTHSGFLRAYRPCLPVCCHGV